MIYTNTFIEWVLDPVIVRTTFCIGHAADEQKYTDNSYNFESLLSTYSKNN